LNKQEEILNSIISGNNQKVLSYLYETTLRKIRSYILKNNGSKEEADDIFQDAAIVFFQTVRENKFDRGHEIDAFIYTVARNLWINKAKRGRFQENFDFPDKYENATDYVDQLGELIEKEKSSAMKKVFDLLDEKCKNILRYYLYDKLSMKEIAAKMGYSSEDVVKTNHYRCKQYLTKLVTNNPEIESLLKP